MIGRTRPLFEQRHFEWLADFAKNYLNERDIRALAAHLAGTNSHFKCEKFLKACGLESS